MARKKKETLKETFTPEITEMPEITEAPELPEGELDKAGRYDSIDIAPGRVILEELNSGKTVPPFIIVNAQRITEHKDGFFTVRGMLRNGESIKYKLIKKKNG